jgi:hypothetical protein
MGQLQARCAARFQARWAGALINAAAHPRHYHSYRCGGLFSLPASFVPRVLSRLASTADSALPRMLAPVALLVIEQVVHWLAGRALGRLAVAAIPLHPALDSESCYLTQK